MVVLAGMDTEQTERAEALQAQRRENVEAAIAERQVQTSCSLPDPDPAVALPFLTFALSLIFCCLCTAFPGPFTAVVLPFFDPSLPLHCLSLTVALPLHCRCTAFFSPPFFVDLPLCRSASICASRRYGSSSSPDTTRKQPTGSHEHEQHEPPSALCR